MEQQINHFSDIYLQITVDYFINMNLKPEIELFFFNSFRLIDYKERIIIEILYQFS